MSAETEIREVLATYERALNTGDASLAASCYTSDGVFMPTTLPTVVGLALEDNYANFFAHFGMAIVFTIDEIISHGSFAYALTRSNGMQTHRDDGTVSPESNRELFIFTENTEGWKIARYIFNKPA